MNPFTPAIVVLSLCAVFLLVVLVTCEIVPRLWRKP